MSRRRPAVRPRPRRAGTRRREARELCSACYARARRDETLIDHERLNWPSGELLAEYQLLIQQRVRPDVAAERLGVTPARCVTCCGGNDHTVHRQVPEPGAPDG
ncbi:MAG: hypothetical protein GEV09_13160 [Pseudonocardiaceae bacterium]|nr:hypothetical protein [Pseudonocardiaceae bacterium]